MKSRINTTQKPLKALAWFSSTFLAFCPACYIAFTLSFSQAGVVAVIAQWFSPFVIGLIILSLINYYITFRRHRLAWPLIIASIGAVLFIYSNYISYFREPISQFTGLLLFAIAALIDVNASFARRKQCAIPNSNSAS